MDNDSPLYNQLLQKASSIGEDKGPKIQLQAMPLNPGPTKFLAGALKDPEHGLWKVLQNLKDMGPATSTDVKDPYALAKTTFFDEYPRSAMYNAAGWGWNKYAAPKLHEYGLPASPGELITKVRGFMKY